jgi:hypothetical protein
MTPITLTDLLAIVADEISTEGSTYVDATARALFHRCIGEIYRETKAYFTYWKNNGGLTDITIVNNLVDLPIDLLVPIRVEWDGAANKVDIRSISWLNENDPGWENTLGDPYACAFTGSQLHLSSSPQGIVIGKLVIRGYGVPDDDDVLAQLPIDIANAPVSYILSKWRVKSTHQPSIARYQRYKEEWQQDRPRLVNAIQDRALVEFSY